jgi:hypothetical protein
LKSKKNIAKRQTHKEAPAQPTAADAFIHRTWAGIAIAVLGIVVGQAILYGPSLIGKKILLPLDLLAAPGAYLPLTEQYKNIIPHNATQSDLILGFEPVRKALSEELTAGRFPLWTPHLFAGTPGFRLSLSPAWLLAFLIVSPVVLAWTQLILALIAGLGMYYFCRRILGLSPWPSVIAAWCYPLTGAYVLWVGQLLPAVMCWLPWSLSAVDRAVRAPRGWGGPALGIMTVMLLLSGAMDIAGQVLLASGLYALWCIWDEYRSQAFSLKGLRILGILALAWLLGFACSMWLLVPAADYVTTGSRMIHRGAGVEERPPVGLKALPQVVLPDIYGSDVRGSFRIGAVRLPESSAMAYAGSVSCLVLAPLAWFSYKRRSAIGILILLGFFSLGWTLNVPLITWLLRLPGLNMMSHNRMVFVAGFALTVLGAIGLEALLRREVHYRWWFVIPAILLAALCGWCLYRSLNLPEPVASQLEATVEKAPIGDIDEPWEVAEIQRNFRTTYAVNAVFCGAGAAVWCFLILGSRTAGWLVPALTALLYTQLVYFGYGFAAQTNPELYFPKLPIFERIAAGPPGRIIGVNCLPANLAQAIRLPDVRGYDGVDPAAMVELLLTARYPMGQEMPYAATQYMSPVLFNDQKTGSLRIPPVLDMLNVRYLIFRGTPPPEVEPSFVDTDYWVHVNDRAMPRAFVPRHVQVIAEAKARLHEMTRVEFDPSDIAYVEKPIGPSDESKGTVEFVKDTPNRVTLLARMQTSGLVVLADRWDSGWRAYVNDAEVPIIRVNHAVRGVLVAPGTSAIRFEYLPSGFFLGLAITAAGGICLLAWACVLFYRCRQTSIKRG